MKFISFFPLLPLCIGAHSILLGWRERYSFWLSLGYSVSLPTYPPTYLSSYYQFVLPYAKALIGALIFGRHRRVCSEERARTRLYTDGVHVYTLVCFFFLSFQTGGHAADFICLGASAWRSGGKKNKTIYWNGAHTSGKDECRIIDPLSPFGTFERPTARTVNSLYLMLMRYRYFFPIFFSSFFVRS